MSVNDPDHKTREKLLGFAARAGADQADVIAIRSKELDVSVRNGALEDAGSAESFGIGLRAFIGDRHAYGSTADASDAGLERLAAQVVDMAKIVPPDPFSRLARADEYARDIPDLDLFDKNGTSDVHALGDLARAAEAAAIGVKGISKSDGAHAGQSASWIGLSNSNGFSSGYAQSAIYLSLSVIGGSDDHMETDHASAQTTHAADLEEPKAVGLRAAERTLARLNPRTGKTGRYPVLFDARVAASLLRSLARAAYGSRIAKGTSFLCDHMGKSVCSQDITIVDDPFRTRGLRSGPFDAEGLAPSKRIFIDRGVLSMYFMDMRAAARLKMESTAHATRGLSSAPSPSPSNLWIENGTITREAMIAEIGEGLLVTELMGANISLATGDYSRGCSGFWIEKGQIAYPVSEMTIAGNLKDMFMHMSPANDLAFRHGIDAPSLRVDGMTVATR